MLRQRNSKASILSIAGLVGWFIIALGLAACGDSTPTVRPVPATATPAPPAPLAYLADTEFKFSDEAEKANRTLLNSRPDFPAYASWTQSNHWYLLVRDSSAERLQQRVGKDARILPVTYLGESLNTRGGSSEAYMLTLNRVTVDVKAAGAKEAGQLLFNRASRQFGLQNGLLVFALGNDQIFVLATTAFSPEKVLGLASVGKVELVSLGDKNLADGTVIATSANPALGNLKLKDTTTYNTLAENSDFSSFAARNQVQGSSLPGILDFQMRTGAKLYDYTRANIGKSIGLVFDRQIVTSARISAAIKDKGEVQVPRWAGPGGQADMQRFIDMMNANPPQLFESKTLYKIPTWGYSGTFTR